MYFILILILIAALAYLVYKQAKSEQQWQAELQEHHKTHPRYKIIDGYKAEPEANESAEPQAQQLELPVETEQEPEAPTAILPSDGLSGFQAARRLGWRRRAAYCGWLLLA